MAFVVIKNVKNGLYASLGGEDSFVFCNAQKDSAQEFAQAAAGGGKLSYRVGEKWLNYRDATGAVKMDAQFGWKVQEVAAGVVVFFAPDARQYMGISISEDRTGLYVVGANDPNSDYCRFNIEEV